MDIDVAAVDEGQGLAVRLTVPGEHPSGAVRVLLVRTVAQDPRHWELIPAAAAGGAERFELCAADGDFLAAVDLLRGSTASAPTELMIRNRRWAESSWSRETKRAVGDLAEAFLQTCSEW